MKIASRPSLALLFSLLIGLCLAPRANADSLDCDGTTLEQQECMGAKISIANQELQTIAGQIKSSLKTQKRELSRSQAITEIESRFEGSQAAWSKYRDAECSLSGADLLGGNREPLEIQNCQFTQTVERTKRLNQLWVDQIAP